MLHKVRNLFTLPQPAGNTLKASDVHPDPSGAYVSAQQTRQSAPHTNVAPISFAAWENQPSDIEKEWVLLPSPAEQSEAVSRVSPISLPAILSKLINRRDSLIKRLKTMENYHPAFDYFIQAMIKLSEDVECNKATHYTERVNKVLQSMLKYPAFCALYMGVAQACEIEHIETQDDRFVHSQAIQNLLFLEFAVLYECPALPSRYRDLIELGRETVAWQELINGIHTDSTVLKLQESLSLGKQCQLEVSILYQAQRYLKLPFTIAPLDDLVDFPEVILAQIVATIKQKIEDPMQLSQALYRLPFWRAYLLKEYKHDPTVIGRPLARACEEIRQILREKGGQHAVPAYWPLLGPQLDEALLLLFVQGLCSTMKQHIPLRTQYQ
jgi:hypothetical protein